MGLSVRLHSNLHNDIPWRLECSGNEYFDCTLMEISSLSESIVTVPFKRGKDAVDLDVNIDAFTPEFFREVGKRFSERMKELEAEDKKSKGKKKEDAEFFEKEARALEIQREIYASLLSGGVLKDWSVELNGKHVAPTYEVLITRPPQMVEELWLTCLKAAKTVKKRVEEEAEEILENTPSGSRGLHAVGQTG